jgi:hypothetical protein
MIELGTPRSSETKKKIIVINDNLQVKLKLDVGFKDLK